jgi:hypothetical protein
LERRQLFDSTVCVWTGAANDGGKFSSPGNWSNGIPPVSVGETAEFTRSADVTLDATVKNDATAVDNGIVSLDLAGNNYTSQGARFD